MIPLKGLIVAFQKIHHWINLDSKITKLILPLMSSVIELVLKTLFVIFLIPQLALAYRKNRYMGNT